MSCSFRLAFKQRISINQWFMSARNLKCLPNCIPPKKGASLHCDPLRFIPRLWHLSRPGAGPRRGGLVRGRAGRPAPAGRKGRGGGNGGVPARQ